LKCLKDKRINIIDYRDYAIILLMVSTGLRGVEIRRAKLNDIKEVNAKKVLYDQGKGRLDKSEYIKLSKTLLESIDQYLAKRGDTSPFLFISHFRKGNNINVSKAFIYSIFKKRAHAFHLSHLSLYPHMLRHTAARLHLKSGGTLEETLMLLRHVHIETTLIYTLNSNAFDNKISKHVEDYIFKET
jgi:integrase